MIEIGPNLREVLLDFMDKNFQCGSVPGYMLKECFGELIEKAIIKEIKSEAIKEESNGATATVMEKTKEYPAESGYYWLVSKNGNYEICYFDAKALTIDPCCDDAQYELAALGTVCELMYEFVRPMIPISKPGE